MDLLPDDELPQEEDLPIDEDTGDTTFEAKFDEARTAIGKIYAQNEAYREMVSTPGWAILEKALKDLTDSLVDSLKRETDLPKLIRLQAEIKALEALPFVVAKSFIDVEQVKQLLKDSDLPLDS